jgi:RimJ/RimL family protein N-acetyltransferase
MSTDLITPRLHIRGVKAADLPDLMAVNGDAQATRFLPYAPWADLEQAQAWLARMQALSDGGTARQLVLLSRSQGRAIGTLLLFRFDAGSARLELGYVLAPGCWGQGLMREALQAVCTHLFHNLDIRRLEAEVNPANTASCRLLERLGFVLEGRLRQRWLGRPEGDAPAPAYDTNLYGLLASEWQQG